MADPAGRNPHPTPGECVAKCSDCGEEEATTGCRCRDCDIAYAQGMCWCCGRQIVRYEFNELAVHLFGYVPEPYEVEGHAPDCDAAKSARGENRGGGA